MRFKPRDAKNIYAGNPQGGVLGKFLQETGEKCGEMFLFLFCRFSSTDFQGKWPQEIIQKNLNIFHSAPNEVLSVMLLLELEAKTFRLSIDSCVFDIVKVIENDRTIKSNPTKTCKFHTSRVCLWEDKKSRTKIGQCLEFLC